jgi:uncharacterized protein YbjT (DUF2867 family)
MSTVVITGARGYIARALAKSLASRENILRLVSRAAIGPTRSRTGVTIEHVQADLFDTESWHDCLNGVDADLSGTPPGRVKPVEPGARCQRRGPRSLCSLLAAHRRWSPPCKSSQRTDPRQPFLG